jgi:hypothetical protein
VQGVVEIEQPDGLTCCASRITRHVATPDWQSSSAPRRSVRVRSRESAR